MEYIYSKEKINSIISLFVKTHQNERNQIKKQIEKKWISPFVVEVQHFYVKVPLFLFLFASICDPLNIFCFIWFENSRSKYRVHLSRWLVKDTSQNWP